MRGTVHLVFSGFLRLWFVCTMSAVDFIPDIWQEGVHSGRGRWANITIKAAPGWQAKIAIDGDCNRWVWESNPGPPCMPPQIFTDFIRITGGGGEEQAIIVLSLVRTLAPKI
jgi:hypothetical protein